MPDLTYLTCWYAGDPSESRVFPQGPRGSGESDRSFREARDPQPPSSRAWSWARTPVPKDSRSPDHAP